MISTSLEPKPENKVPFKLSSFKFVPNNCGCYILTTFDDQILYIGLAINLNNRFKQHLENPEKTLPSKDGKAIWFHFQSYNSKNLPMLERTWLNQYLNIHGKFPIFNKVSSPIN